MKAKIKTFGVALAAIIGLAFIAWSCGDEDEDEIKGTIYVKGLIDLTGATTDISKSAQNGVLDYIAYINENGGIEGYKVEIDYKDYGYVADKAKEIYENWRKEENWDKIVTIFGWGTPDSVALKEYTNEDKIPYIGESYLISLADPSKFPYNFFLGTDYNTSMRLAMKFIKDSGGNNVAFAYCSEASCSTYGSGPIPDGRDEAQKQGLTILPDVTVEMAYKDDDGNALSDDKLREKIHSVMEEYFKDNPAIDWIWIGNTTKTTGMIIEAGEKFSPATKFIVNVWGFDENLDKFCTGNVGRKRAYGVMPFTAYGDTVNSDEMVNLIEIHDASHSASEYADVRYVQGYARVYLWKKAVERLIKAEKEVTGENIKAAMEEFNNESTGGLTPPITFTSTDHKPNKSAKIYSLDENGKLKFEASVNL